MLFLEVLLSLGLLTGLSSAQQSLGKYNVDTTKISVSGMSSGASMATQVHVAYSSVFMGVALIGGNPYYCSQGDLGEALGPCMDEPAQIDITALTTKTSEYETTGEIDPTSNMQNDRVFILGGALDTTVYPGCGQKAQQYYETYVNMANFKTEFTLQAAHTFPSVDYGNACDESRDPWISRCDYDSAFEAMDHLYGNLTRPDGSTTTPGDFYMFDQTEFFTDGYDVSMDDYAYVYVPTACIDGTTPCMLHVAFHGCQQGRYRLDEEYVLNTGYNEVGELNNVIIIYPQVKYASVNPMGCWDWWGYTVGEYATKYGDQPLAVWRMVERVAF